MIEMTIERREDDNSAAAALASRARTFATVLKAAPIGPSRAGSLALPAAVLVGILLLGGAWLGRHLGAPVAQSIAPLGGATNVLPTSDVRIGFDRPIGGDGEKDLDIRLRTGEGTPVK